MTKHNGLYKMKNGVIFIHIFTIPRPLHLFVLIHISILDHFIYTWSSAFSIVCNIVLLVMNFLIFCSLKMSLSLLWLLLSLSKNITRRQFFFQFLKNVDPLSAGLLCSDDKSACFLIFAPLYIVSFFLSF